MIRGAFVRSAILVLWGVVACPPAAHSAPNYSGGLAQEPAELAPYADSGIRLKLPPGWASSPITSQDSDVKAQFKKAGTGATMLVICQGTFVSRAGLGVKPLSMAAAATTSSKEMWPQQVMPNGATFMAYAATVAAEGQQVPTNVYLAWKMPRGFGCKYGIVTFAAQQEAKQIEGDFLAIVRSLDHR
jgi:hypothetical protein